MTFISLCAFHLSGQDTRHSIVEDVGKTGRQKCICQRALIYLYMYLYPYLYFYFIYSLSGVFIKCHSSKLSFQLMWCFSSLGGHCLWKFTLSKQMKAVVFSVPLITSHIRYHFIQHPVMRKPQICCLEWPFWQLTVQNVTVTLVCECRYAERQCNSVITASHAQSTFLSH